MPASSRQSVIGAVLCIVVLGSICFLAGRLLSQPYACKLQSTVPRLPAVNVSSLRGNKLNAWMHFGGYLQYTSAGSDEHQVSNMALSLASFETPSDDRWQLDFNCAQVWIELDSSLSAINRIIIHLSRPHIGLSSCATSDKYAIHNLTRGIHYICLRRLMFPCYGLARSGMQLVTTLVVDELEFQVGTGDGRREYLNCSI